MKKMANVRNSHKKISKKQTLLLVGVLMLLLVSLTVMAIKAPTFENPINAPVASKYNSDLIGNMATIMGCDTEQAKSMVEAMSASGMIDKDGNLKASADTFVVDGKTISNDALRQLAYTMPADAVAVVDGETITYGKLKQLFIIKEANAIVEECRTSKTVLTQEHLEKMSLFYDKVTRECIQTAPIEKQSRTQILLFFSRVADL